MVALFEQGFINSIVKEQLHPSLIEKTNPSEITTKAQNEITPWYQNLLIYVSTNINALVVGTLATFLGGIMLHFVTEKLK